MQQLTVGLDERSYPIWIGNGILAELPCALQAVSFPNRVSLITNTTVAEFYAEQTVQTLASAGFRVSVVRLPDGEEYKTLDTLAHLYDTLIEQRFDRHDGLLALGGGVIGDLVGFAAATYLRGIPFAQIPTTLLAQVDSSVGGKTGVNHPQGKNLIGAFYQPRHVHIDVGLLATLPDREFAAGLAEVVKYGVIADADFFSWLEQHRQLLVGKDSRALVEAVMKSCQIKANVVENDEKEQGLRAILNLGHTFGHAIETLAGYGVIRHGEAVAIGMVLAARTSCEMGLCSRQDVDRISQLLVTLNLPVQIPDFTAAEYAAVMSLDKKVKGGEVRLVLNHGIGVARMHRLDDPQGLMSRLLHPIMPTDKT
ncbi:MAG: 3-dehydroquinate synthase [Desulfuromonas sp.]|nr:MAG: 3-dehydroquinate synthase [Desulfuromonas sp.]